MFGRYVVRFYCSWLNGVECRLRRMDREEQTGVFDCLQDCESEEWEHFKVALQQTGSPCTQIIGLE